MSVEQIANAFKIIQEFSRLNGLEFTSQSLIHSFHWHLDLADFSDTLKMRKTDQRLQAAIGTIKSKIREMYGKLNYRNGSETDSMRKEWLDNYVRSTSKD